MHMLDQSEMAATGLPEEESDEIIEIDQVSLPKEGDLFTSTGHPSWQTYAELNLQVVQQYLANIRQRLRLLSCKWGDCDARLNCIDTLTQHTLTHACEIEINGDESQVAQFWCQWTDPPCESAFSTLDEFASHIVAHTTAVLYCPLDGEELSSNFFFS
jgi:hypothetical protein